MSRAFMIGLVMVVVAGGAVLYPFANIYFTEVRPRTLFPRRVQQRVSASELQAWALACIKGWDTNYPYYPPPVTNMHPAVCGLWIHKPTAYMYLPSEQDTEYVVVSYGAGGCGHWGVEIGPTNRPTPVSRQARRYTAWAPGVCFFDGQ
jgi:hypothetical protein